MRWLTAARSATVAGMAIGDPIIPPKPFTTDGCSGAVWKTLTGKEGPWRNCCVEHDKLYWMGGSRRQRQRADIELMRCVADNGHPIIAFAMWAAVRFGGHPWLPFPWRWGYGWKYPRGYTRKEA